MKPVKRAKPQKRERTKLRYFGHKWRIELHGGHVFADVYITTTRARMRQLMAYVESDPFFDEAGTGVAVTRYYTKRNRLPRLKAGRVVATVYFNVYDLARYHCADTLIHESSHVAFAACRWACVDPWDQSHIEGEHEPEEMHAYTCGRFGQQVANIWGMFYEHGDALYR